MAPGVRGGAAGLLDDIPRQRLQVVAQVGADRGHHAQDCGHRKAGSLAGTAFRTSAIADKPRRTGMESSNRRVSRWFDEDRDTVAIVSLSLSPTGVPPASKWRRPSFALIRGPRIARSSSRKPRGRRLPSIRSTPSKKTSSKTQRNGALADDVSGQLVGWTGDRSPAGVTRR